MEGGGGMLDHLITRRADFLSNLAALSKLGDYDVTDALGMDDEGREGQDGDLTNFASDVIPVESTHPGICFIATTDAHSSVTRKNVNLKSSCFIFPYKSAARWWWFSKLAGNSF
jgi:hypothetical protein